MGVAYFNRKPFQIRILFDVTKLFHKDHNCLYKHPQTIIFSLVCENIYDLPPFFDSVISLKDLNIMYGHSSLETQITRFSQYTSV